VASLHDPRAGIDPTLMYPSARGLRAALINQADRARGKDGDSGR
jgi:hypothetical protein